MTFNNRDTKAMGEICSKLTIKTPESLEWKDSTHCSGVSIVDFERATVGWIRIWLEIKRNKILQMRDSDFHVPYYPA